MRKRRRVLSLSGGWRLARLYPVVDHWRSRCARPRSASRVALYSAYASSACRRAVAFSSWYASQPPRKVLAVRVWSSSSTTSVTVRSRKARSWLTTTRARRCSSTHVSSRSSPARSRSLVGSSRRMTSWPATSSDVSAALAASPPDSVLIGWSSTASGRPSPVAVSSTLVSWSAAPRSSHVCERGVVALGRAMARWRPAPPWPAPAPRSPTRRPCGGSRTLAPSPPPAAPAPGRAGRRSRSAAAARPGRRPGGPDRRGP